MMPLAMVQSGQTVQIESVCGSEKTKRFLTALGLVSGEFVGIVSELGGNLIVNVKDSRIAISKAMANKILIHSVSP